MSQCSFIHSANAESCPGLAYSGLALAPQRSHSKGRQTHKHSNNEAPQGGCWGVRMKRKAEGGV